MLLFKNAFSKKTERAEEERFSSYFKTGGLRPRVPSGRFDRSVILISTQVKDFITMEIVQTD